SQRQQLSRNLKRARSDLKESLFRAYRHLVLLDKDNKLRSIDLGQITSSMAPSLVDIYVNSLTSTDDVTKAVGAARLVKYWPPALTEWSTKGARDAFYSSPQLPRLLNADAIRRTIADGVTEGRLGYATKEGDRLTLLKFGESLSESEVEISDEFFVLRAEDAKKLQKPPRLASLSIHPGQVTLRPGEQASFSCAGQDQYGQPFRCEPTWSATGGTITDEGLFTAATGSPGGLFTVRAESGGVEATADVRINAAKKYDDEDDDKDKEEPAGLIRWQGEVPPQKWMNFYTKVLSRFGATSGLKLTVSFEAAADGEQGKAKAEEARSGLKELGLKDDVSVS
ncbi:MAG TPA: hypothetical protein VF170_00640, partial [Planctomycetaceae bacterium]